MINNYLLVDTMSLTDLYLFTVESIDNLYNIIIPVFSNHLHVENEVERDLEVDLELRSPPLQDKNNLYI